VGMCTHACIEHKKRVCEPIQTLEECVWSCFILSLEECISSHFIQAVL
jgi:hypothetical protein